MMTKKAQALSENQQRAVELVASGQTNRQIAETLDNSEFTVSRWRQEPGFIAAVNEILRDSREAARERLRSLVGKAVDTIEASLNDAELSASERLKAAFKIIELVGIHADEPIGPVSADVIKHQREEHDLFEAIGLQ